MKQYISACAFVLAAVSSAGAQQGQPKAVQLALPDQYEQKHDIAG